MSAFRPSTASVPVLALLSTLLLPLLLTEDLLIPRALRRLPALTSLLRPPLPPPLRMRAPPSPPPFTVPHLIRFHATRAGPGVTLRLFTAGLDMGESRRNLSCAACLVGRDVYPAARDAFSVATCHVPRPLAVGEPVAPVILKDAAFHRAAAGPVTLPTGVVAELLPAHAVDLPDDVSVHGALARSSLALVPSEHAVEHPADEPDPRPNPRWQICLATQIKPHSHLLPYWVDYHRRIGVDHVYIFDNGANIPPARTFASRTDVEVVRWPYHKSQSQLMSILMHVLRTRCERVLLCDVDEYIMLGLGTPAQFAKNKPLVAYAQRVEKKGFRSLKFPYLTMTHSGQVRKPLAAPAESFVHRLKKQTFENGKSMCSLDEGMDTGLVHSCGRVKGKQIPLYKESVDERSMFPKKLRDKAFTVHFRTRSWEEWVEKLNSGQPSLGKRVADRERGARSVDKPAGWYMNMNKVLYTHFRRVYRRVMNEGRADTATVVRIVEGRRCAMTVRVDGWLRGIHERCRTVL